MDHLGDPITNKKLQKLLYYIEAWALVYVNSMIKEDFQAWVHGPVIPSVYREYKQFGYQQISIHYDCGESSIDRCNSLKKSINLQEDQWSLITSVLNQYGSMSSFQLERLSHSEKPWIDARGIAEPLESCSTVIDKKSMKTYFSSLIKHNEQEEEKI